jgi:hypothetical protein
VDWSVRAMERKRERGRGGALLWKGRGWSLMQGLDKILSLKLYPPSSKHLRTRGKVMLQ